MSAAVVGVVELLPQPFSRSAATSRIATSFMDVPSACSRNSNARFLFQGYRDAGWPVNGCKSAEDSRGGLSCPSRSEAEEPTAPPKFVAQPDVSHEVPGPSQCERRFHSTRRE